MGRDPHPRVLAEKEAQEVEGRDARGIVPREESGDLPLDGDAVLGPGRVVVAHVVVDERVDDDRGPQRLQKAAELLETVRGAAGAASGLTEPHHADGMVVRP